MLTTYMIIAALCALMTLSWGVYRDEDPVYWAVFGLLLGPLAILYLLVSRIPLPRLPDRLEFARNKRPEPAEEQGMPGVGEAFWSLLGTGTFYIALTEGGEWVLHSFSENPLMPLLGMLLFMPLALAATVAIFGSVLTGVSRMIRNRRIYFFSLMPLVLLGALLAAFPWLAVIWL